MVLKEQLLLAQLGIINSCRFASVEEITGPYLWQVFGTCEIFT